MPRAFANLWAEVIGESWDDNCGATVPAKCQQLRNEMDALVAHQYNLSREDFAQILGTFSLVFSDDAAGAAKMDALLVEYNHWMDKVSGWTRV